MKIFLIIIGLLIIGGFDYAICKVASSVEHDYEEDLEDMRREYELTKNNKKIKKKKL